MALKLSPSEREVLSCSSLGGDLSILEIANRTKVRAHTVQHILKKFRDANVITWLPRINVHPLGLAYYGIFFSVAATPTQRTRLLELMSACEELVWLAEFNGEFRYGVDFVTRTHWEAAKIFQDLLESSKVSLIKKTLATRLSIVDSERRYLSARRYHPPFVVSEPTAKSYELSPSERKVLEVISSAGFNSYRQAASIAGMPHTTFAAKIRALRKEAILVGSIHAIDSQKFGRESAKLLITLRSEDLAFRRQIRNFILDWPETFHFIESFGEWDYEVNVDVENERRLRELVDDLFKKFEYRIDEVKILSGMATIKRVRFPVSHSYNRDKN